MEEILTIPAGIRTVKVISAEGKEFPQFYTRKETKFSPEEKISSEKGTIAFKKAGATIVVKSNAVRIPEAVLTAIHQGLCLLAGVCNGAISWDGAGFSKTDTRLGKQLAGVWPLTTAQAFMGARLCNKYRRQLAPEITEKAASILPPKKEKKAKLNEGENHGR